MGLVVYIRKASGEEVQADFPLADVVDVHRLDGSHDMMSKEQFASDYVAKLPELPHATLPQDVVSQPSDETPHRAPPATTSGLAYEPPTLTDLPATPVPSSHQAWFAVLFGELRSLHTKVETLIHAHPVLKEAIDNVENRVIAAVERKITGG